MEFGKSFTIDVPGHPEHNWARTGTLGCLQHPHHPGKWVCLPYHLPPVTEKSVERMMHGMIGEVADGLLIVDTEGSGSQGSEAGAWLSRMLKKPLRSSRNNDRGVHVTGVLDDIDVAFKLLGAFRGKKAIEITAAFANAEIPIQGFNRLGNALEMLQGAAKPPFVKSYELGYPKAQFDPEMMRGGVLLSEDEELERLMDALGVHAWVFKLCHLFGLTVELDRQQVFEELLGERPYVLSPLEEEMEDSDWESLASEISATRALIYACKHFKAIPVFSKERLSEVITSRHTRARKARANRRLREIGRNHVRKKKDGQRTIVLPDLGGGVNTETQTAAPAPPVVGTGGQKQAAGTGLTKNVVELEPLVAKWAAENPTLSRDKYRDILRKRLLDGGFQLK